MKISIIGSAGRKDDAERFTRQLFIAMFNQAKKHVNMLIKENNLEYSSIELVSGGAAYADHIAVLLFLKYHKKGIRLTLHLPCKFGNNQFLESGSQYKNARYANGYHRPFSKKCKINSLNDIHRAIQLGANIHVHKGFHSRNDYVAQTDHMVAFTFGVGQTLKPGGTKYTWDKSDCPNKTHYSIQALI